MMPTQIINVGGYDGEMLLDHGRDSLKHSVDRRMNNEVRAPILGSLS